MALLRIAYENHLLINYLSKNETEAKLWFEGKIFKPTFLRENVSYASDSLYKEMCEFVHSSFKSTLAFTEIEKGRTKATIGEYNKWKFRDVLILMLMTMATTIIWLSLTFAQELMSNEEWHRGFKETVPKLWKYLNGMKKIGMVVVVDSPPMFFCLAAGLTYYLWSCSKTANDKSKDTHSCHNYDAH